VNQPGRLAFLVHPRDRLAEEIAPRRLPVPRMSMASVDLAGSHLGHVVALPYGAGHMTAQPREAQDRVARAVDHAVGLGASVVGLSALTASVTAGGVSLRHRTDVAVTNGNAFTAAIVHDQASDLLARSGAGRVAIVGATGSVGSTVAKMLVRTRDADEVILVAANERRLDSLRCNLSGRGVAVRSSTDLPEVRSADVVVLLAPVLGSVLEPQHLGPGTVVLDATQPSSTTTQLARARHDVRILDGGSLSIPSLEIRGGNVGLPDGRARADFAETALLALSGHQSHFSIGIPHLEQVDLVRSLARDHAHLGFTVAQPTSFGVPVTGPAGSEVGEAVA
jgi:predicted amino acid dehydrogenase